MKKLSILISALVVSVLVLAACSGGQNNNNSTGTESPMSMETSIPNTGALGTALPTDDLSSDVYSTPIANSTGMGLPTMESTLDNMESSATPLSMNTLPVNPTMVGTAGIPTTGYGQLVQLSSLLNYVVVDNTGAQIGRVSDYVINMCEAQIVYAVVDSANGGNSILIPYAAVTQRTSQPQSSGQNVLTLNVTAAQIADAPVLDLKTLDFNNPSWESSLTSYWRQYVQLALTTECRVPAAGSTAVPGQIGTQVPGSLSTMVPIGTDTAPSFSGTPFSNLPMDGTAQPTGVGSSRVTVYRIALASDVLKAKVEEGNGKLVGMVRDVMAFDNTGNIYYFLAQPVTGTQNGMPAVGTQTGNSVIGTPNSSMSGTQVAPDMGSMSGTQIAPDISSMGNDLIPLPAGAVTIRHTAASGSRDTVLVLLVQTNVFQNGPTYNSTSNALDSNWTSYWSQFIPMTQSALPK